MKILTSRTMVVLVLLLAFAGTTHAKKYKPINEIPNQVPESDEEKRIWEIGIAHHKKVRGTDELVNNAELEKYLEGIVSRLMGDMVEDIGLEIDVLVFKDPTVNAWVYPSGIVAVQTGMLAVMENEAQLAAILGHEVAHFLNRHAFIQIKAKQKQSIVGKGLGVLATAAVAASTGQVNAGLLNSGQIWTDLVTSGYSRKLETKADLQGLQLMIAAGYPPDQAIPGFETMRMEEDDVIDASKMWSSHPDIDARKKNLSKVIKKTKADSNKLGLDENSYLRSVSLAVLTNSQLLVANRKFDDAIKSLTRHTEIVAEDARGHYLLGEAMRKQSSETSLDARIAAYQKAVTNDPSFADPYRELGMAFRQQGKNSQADDAFAKYLNLASGAADAPIINWYRQSLAGTAAGAE